MSDARSVSRREFLKESAAAAAAISVGLAAAREAFAQQAAGSGGGDMIEFACVGTGAQGSLDLTKALMAPNVRCVAVCDIYEPNLKRGLEIAGRVYPQVRSYTDYREMLDKEKSIQAVLIATPLNVHAPVAIDSLQAGKHVFCEKTMAYTVEDCKRMCRAARDAGKILQIGHQRRYNPFYHHALKLITKDKALGKITQIRALWHRNGDWRRPVPDPKYERLLNWRLYRDSSQGLMAELGSHQVDVVNWFLGATPISVMGVGGIDYWKDGREVWDNVSVIFEYPDGVKLTYTSITTNQYDGYYEQFMGTEGTLIMIGETGGKLFREPKASKLAWMELASKVAGGGVNLDLSHSPGGGAGPGQALGEGQKMDSGYPYQAELASFFECIRKNTQPLCSGEEALKAAVSILKANEAIEKGVKIALTPDMFTA
ncbi:MAG: Gfo/Idh/MocA family protein [Armatimonadota bacterium]